MFDLQLLALRGDGTRVVTFQLARETALMTAARTGRIGPGRRLLDRGASVAPTDRKGQTALMWAAAARHADVDGNAVLLGKRAPGISALVLAVENGHFDLAAETVEALSRVMRAAGIDPPAPPPRETPGSGKPAYGPAARGTAP